MAIICGSRHWIGVAAVGLFATALVAQPPVGDPLAEARARQKIADQKLEISVGEAVREADRVARSNPAKAAQILRAAQTNVTEAQGVSEEARKRIAAVLQAKLTGSDGRPPAAPAKLEFDTPEARASRKAAFDKYDAEIKAVRDGLRLIERYQSERKYAEARGVASLLTKQYPNNAALLVLQQKDSFGDNLTEAKLLSQMHAERYTVAMNAVARSNMPAVNDIEFPKDWKELTARRKKGEPQLTAKEKTLLAALDKPVTVSFNGQPLSEVLQRMSNTMGQDLLLDEKSLTDLGLDLKKPLTLNADGVPARIALRQLLASMGLTYVVKDEVIQIVTVEKARDMLVTRVYYLGDVVQGIGTFGGLAWGPYVDHLQTQQNVKAIVDAIKASVDPLSWSDKSGPGSISFDYLSMSLIVRASTEIHATLGAKIGGALMSRFFPTAAECGHHVVFGTTRVTTFAGEHVQLSHAEIPAHGVVDWHAHPNEQVGFMIAGRAVFTIGDEEQTLGPGDFFFIPGGVRHRVVALDADVKALDVFYPIREEYK